MSSVKYTSMLFASKIRELRESKQMLQRHISAALDMDNAMYCKIEKGERRAKREQISMIADILQADPEELLTLWLADQVAEVVEKDKEISDKVLDTAKQKLND
ncbi:MAG: helix-turn-helix domain-containing protein [Holosporales bacterium]|nr:helix-turn-helix domain-containing protein [Holosporales bacterium]